MSSFQRCVLVHPNSPAFIYSIATGTLDLSLSQGLYLYKLGWYRLYRYFFFPTKILPVPRQTRCTFVTGGKSPELGKTKKETILVCYYCNLLHFFKQIGYLIFTSFTVEQIIKSVWILI